MISRCDIVRNAVTRRATAGFTLIEMLVVLTILALATALMTGYGKPISAATPGRAAAGKISASLRSARSEAVMNNRRVSFSLDLVNRSYRWGRIAPQMLPGELSLSLLTGRDQLAAGGMGEIEFNPDGSSSGGRVTIAGGGRLWWIGVDWLSGRVSIAEKPQ